MLIGLIDDVLGEWRIKPQFQCLRLGVLLRDKHFAEGPINADFMVLVVYPRFSLGIIDSCALVLNFALVRKGAKAARKAERSIYLLLVVRRDFKAKPLAER